MIDRELLKRRYKAAKYERKRLKQLMKTIKQLIKNYD